MVLIAERRHWERRTLSATVLFKPVGMPGHPFRSGRMHDISDGGVSFDTDSPPSDGTTIDMFFKPHESAADQRVRGRVVWTRPADGGTYLVGVSFAA